MTPDSTPTTPRTAAALRVSDDDITLHSGLTPSAVVAVESSFARIEERLRAAVIAFHARLLRQAPSLDRALSRDDVAERTTLTNFFCLVALNLRNRERLAPVLSEMGRRGLLRDVTPNELVIAKSILLGTLADFDARWADPGVASAWSSAFDWSLAIIRRK